MPNMLLNALPAVFNLFIYILMENSSQMNNCYKFHTL